MNIYEKISAVRTALLSRNLSKDKKAFKYSYIDLPQIESAVTEECAKVKLMTLVDFPDNHAVMTAFDLESEQVVQISVPVNADMVEIQGSQKIQNVGGMMTYMRRYLYMTMFAISEHDSVEGIGKASQEVAHDMDTTEADKKDPKRTELINKFEKDFPKYLDKLVAYKKVKSLDDIPTDYIETVYAKKVEQKNGVASSEGANA